MRGWSPATLLLFLLHSHVIRVVVGFSVYGTENGIDVDGDEPVCIFAELEAPYSDNGRQPTEGDQSDNEDGDRSESDGDQQGPVAVPPAEDSPIFGLIEDVNSVQDETDVDGIDAAAQILAELDDALFAAEKAFSSGTTSSSTESSGTASPRTSSEGPGSTVSTEGSRGSTGSSSTEGSRGTTGSSSPTSSGESSAPGFRTRHLEGTDLDRQDVQLLSSCFNGTFVTLEALDLEQQSSLFRSLPYTFRLQVQTNASDLFPQPESDASFSASLFFRFVLCNALKSGYCNPVVPDPKENDSNSTVVVLTDSTTLVGTVDKKRKMVFSNWALPSTTEVDADSRTVALDPVDVRLRVPRETPLGLYRLVVHTLLVMVANDGGEVTVKRLDTTAQGDVSIVNVQPEPEILEMTPSMRIFIFVLIGVYDAIMVAMLVFLYIYRTHAAIRLAQGSFLAGLLVAALVGGTFTFVFMPEEDWYCIAWGPLVIFPFTLMGAILVARLWRVYVTLSGAVKLGRNTSRDETEATTPRRSNRLSQILDVGSWNILGRMVNVLSFFAKLPLLTLIPGCRDERSTRRRHGRQSHLRQTASGTESMQLVLFLVLPEVVLQTAGDITYKPSLELVLDDSNRVGRYFCDREWDWVSIAGLVLTALMYGLAVLLAWQGREFPSIFNEKDAIFNTAIISSLLLLINVMVVEMIEDPTTSPDSSAFLRCITFIGISCLVIFNLVYPKIMRARRGEKIVVGKLLKAYGNMDEDSDSTISSEKGGQPQKTFLAGSPIVVGKNDALPQGIEMQIHQLYTLLRIISEKCACGRPLSKNEWDQMSRQVAKLKTYLDRVSLDWDGDDGPASPNEEIGAAMSSTQNETLVDSKPGSSEKQVSDDGSLAQSAEKQVSFDDGSVD